MNLLTLDLNLLRVLDAMLQTRSTVRAGEQIGLSQPAVSSALNRLRQHLGDPLFVRDGQHMAPTDFAASLEVPLRRTFDELETLLSGASDFDPATADTVFKLSGSDFFAELLMPPLAQYVSDSAPGVRISLVDLVPDDHVAKLKDYSVDMALIPRIEFPAWAEFRNVFKSRFVVGARRGHERLKRAGLLPGDTVPIDLFCDLGHIAFSQVGSLSVMGDAALARIGRQRRVAMTMPVFGGICHAIADSDFIALLPDQIGHKLGARLGLDLYEPPMPIAPVQLCMVWHRRNAASAAHRWLRDTVAGVLGEMPGLPSVPRHHRNSPGANAL